MSAIQSAMTADSSMMTVLTKLSFCFLGMIALAAIWFPSPSYRPLDEHLIPGTEPHRVAFTLAHGWALPYVERNVVLLGSNEDGYTPVVAGSVGTVAFTPISVAGMLLRLSATLILLCQVARYQARRNNQLDRQ